MPSILKLLSRRHPTSLSGVTSLPAPRFLSYNPQYRHVDDIYDPPFSPTPNSLVKPQSPPSKENKHMESTKSKAEDEYPVKSDLPFDFRYSYSETNSDIKPIGFREPPRFSPFGPGRLDRKWTGTSAPAEVSVDHEKFSQQRKDVLAEPLTEEEIAELVEKYRHNDCSRQINLGKGGVTHNMLEDIHNH